MYKSDIQIAQEASLRPIKEIAKAAGIEDEDLELYGKYKAKVNPSKIFSRAGKQGKLILVTAITPTPRARVKPPRQSGLRTD